MDPFIAVEVLKLEHLFSGRFRFHLPWEQRAYAWTETHVGRLVTDLDAASRDKRPRYSLGHVFLAQGDRSKPKAALIDGHQRAMSLTMLFALLRDLLTSSPLAGRLNALIGDATNGFHLTPQENVSQFFADYVQQTGAALRDPPGDIMDLTEAELNILRNRDHLRREVERLAPTSAALEHLATFVLGGCWVIVETVEEEDEAWRLLAIEEETGVAHDESERSKGSLIDAMPRRQQPDAGRVYELAQAIIGPPAMTKLLAHIRTLKIRQRTARPVENDILRTFNIRKTGLTFFETELLPRAEHVMLMRKRQIGNGPALAATAHVLEPLYWLEHQYWMPPALHWLKTMGSDNPETAAFFIALERLAYIMKIAVVDPTVQESRFINLLEDIDAKMPVARMPHLAIEPQLKAAAIANLRSPTFYSKRFHGLVLRRISWNLDPGRVPEPVDGRKVTVEHVLPKNPPQGRDWWTTFGNQQAVTSHCHRLGNLAFLSHEYNRMADTLDYVAKRPILLEAGAHFALTAQAAQHEEWTPSVIMARTEALIAALLTPWELAA